MLQNQLFEIRFTAKQLTRESQKAEKREAEHKIKLREAMKKGEMERAKICAENALREKQQALSLLKLSSRMEAVAQRVNQALVMGKVTKAMGKTVDGMESAFKSLDAEKISKVMDRFATQFDEVDVKTKVMGYVPTSNCHARQLTHICTVTNWTVRWIPQSKPMTFRV